MAQKKRPSKLDKIREKADAIFVGRKEPIQQFRQHLECNSPDDDSFIDIFNIYGQGGVGKTYLVNKFRGMAKAKNALTAYTDEGVTSVVDWMGAAAKQLAEQEAPLKNFTERYEKYLQVQKRLEVDPDAPKDWVSFLTKTAVRGRLAAAKGIPFAGGFVDLVDKDAAADRVSDLASYLYLKWKNKDEVPLVLEPEVVLTPLFFDDLYDYEEDRHISFFIDTYEKTSRFLDKWLRDVMDGKYGDVPVNMTWIISGREKLNANDWSAFASIIRYTPLEPFTFQEAEAYLDKRGITNPSVRETILKLSLNFPIFLAMLAEGTPDDPESVQDTSGDIVGRFLQWIDDPIQRKLALDASVPRYFNMDLIKRLLPSGSDPEFYFDWLCKRPFVQMRAGEWAYHPVVREIMMKYLRHRSPKEWFLLNSNRIGWYYEERANLLGLADREQQFGNDNWQKYMLEYYFHLLLIDYMNILPIAIRAFATTYRLKWNSGARPWSEMIDQAEKFHNNQNWGKILVNGINAQDSKIQMYSFVINSNLVTDPYDSSFFYYKIGDAYFKLKQYDKAIEYLRKVTEINPNDKEIWALIGIACRISGQYDEAIEWYSKTVEINPDDDVAWWGMGYAFLKIKKYDKAIEYCRKAVEINSKSYEAWADMGLAFGKLTKHQKAIDCFHKALEIRPDMHEAWEDMGYAFFKIKKYNKAIDCYRSAAEIKPNNFKAWFGMGIAFEELEEYDKAIECFRKTLEINPDHRATWTLMGIAYRISKQYDRAIECYQKAIKIKPDDQETWVNLGEAYHKLEQYDKAIECYQKAIEIKPDDPRSWLYLGWTCLLKQDITNAEPAFQKTWELSELINETASQNLGHIHLLRSNQPAALEWYRKSLPLWDSVEGFFTTMESDYTDLKMSDHGITREAFDAIIQTLREEADKLPKPMPDE